MPSSWTRPPGRRRPTSGGASADPVGKPPLPADGSRKCRSAEQGVAEEQAQVFAVELEADPVGVTEVQAVLHPAVGAQVVDAGLVQAASGGGELAGRDRDGEVLDPADGLGERRMVVAGEVEEAEQVAVADVEEEVAGAGIVAVLDQLDQRESEELLVEADRLLDVAADEGDVVDPGGGGGRPVGGRAHVALPQPVPAGPDLLQLGSLRLRHDPPPIWSSPARTGAVRPLSAILGRRIGLAHDPGRPLAGGGLAVRPRTAPAG